MSYGNPIQDHNDRVAHSNEWNNPPDFEEHMAGITKDDFSPPERIPVRCRNGHFLVASSVYSSCYSEFDIQGAACGGTELHICYDCWDKLPEGGSQ